MANGRRAGGASFFVWGHLVFALVAVATTVMIWRQSMWPSVIGAGSCVFGAWWMAHALGEPGVILTEVTRTFAYWGTGLIVVAVVIGAIEVANRRSAGDPVGAGTAR